MADDPGLVEQLPICDQGKAFLADLPDALRFEVLAHIGPAIAACHDASE